MNDRIRQAMCGAAAGFTATLPMTFVMRQIYRTLPWTQRYALPPRQITHAVARRLGLWSALDHVGRDRVTLAAHFGYGAAMGGVYGAALPVEQQNAASGMLFGLAVWSGHYFGLFPITGMAASGTRQSWRRNMLMMAAHLLWGGALGVLASLGRREESQWYTGRSSPRGAGQRGARTRPLGFSPTRETQTSGPSRTDGRRAKQRIERMKSSKSERDPSNDDAATVAAEQADKSHSREGMGKHAGGPNPNEPKAKPS